MVRNNVEIDIKVMCIESGTSQVKLAQEIGTTPAYVNRVIRQRETVVNRTFANMVEALGYDIQRTYVKRADREQDPGPGAQFDPLDRIAAEARNG